MRKITLGWIAASATALLIAGNAPAADDEIVAVTGATVYASPDAAPIAGGVVLMQSGRITGVGAGLAIPANAKVIDGKGLYAMAGFQNSHVHFSEGKWNEAAAQPAEAIARQLREMLTRYGFTTVVDTGSYLENTLALRKRIETLEVPGPRILAGGGSIYPHNGIPFYVKERVPADVLQYLANPASPEQAAAIVQRTIAEGARIIKLFTGSIIAPGSVMPMREDIAHAAATEAHRHNALVFTHPSNDEGIATALAAGVDVLAHTTPRGGAWDGVLVATMKERRMSLIPTLKLWSSEVRRFGGTAEAAEEVTARGVQQLRVFSRGGGQVLFGTDVGYMVDYDTADEYARMSQAGLSTMQILASLTTAPAARFGEENRRGRIAAGMDADLVLLEADPAQDARNFSKVRYTIRAGRTIYSP